MVSQHPDHAHKPHWHHSPFIRTQDEIYEAHHSFFDLGSSEYKWDWEGKFVDEAVVERLLSEYYDDFKEQPLGKEKFLTFRLPNPKVETEFRLGRAFMGILGAAGLAEQAGLHPPLFEVILPMTETSQEMIDIQEAYQEMTGLKHPLLKVETGRLKDLELIPLFEQVDVILNSDKVVQEYLDYYQSRFKRQLEYIRPYVARSDPALNSGLVPTVLSIKVALGKYSKLPIPSYPIIGSASLPFRGGLTPLTVEQFANEYKGIRTALIQSAFRYDYPHELVKQAVARMENIFPSYQAVVINDHDEKLIREAIPVFEQQYQPVIEQIADVINMIAGSLPKRRERVQHVGLFGYSRGVGKVKLPRAIGFTAALYSIGVPPELIGTGRGLKILKESHPEAYDVVLKYYINLEHDLQRVARFVNKDNLARLTKGNSAWQAVADDIRALESLLGISFEPDTKEEHNHVQVTSRILSQLDAGALQQDTLEQAAQLRKSMG